MVSRGEKSSARKLYVEMTSYTAFCDTGCTGITALGVNVKNTIHYQGYRVIAVDPKVIPLHSIVRVETKNEVFLAYAADTGGAIKGSIIDLLVENNTVAKRNGRQLVTLTVMREGKGGK
ncbi:hypothetical protein EVU96_08715 [Bacillus infantis]|nr:hypothetical protein EVU96_08715 [Bacillus infantis]